MKKNIYPIVRQVYEDLDPAVQNCVDCYTSDWVVVNRKYQQYSTSLRVVDTRDTIGRYQTVLMMIYITHNNLMTGTSLVKHEYECDSYSQDVTPQEQVL